MPMRSATRRTCMVSMHPVQVRLVAERIGILSAIDPDSKRTIARLSRQLRILGDRIDRLHDNMLSVAERGHECVDEELAFAEASYELATEFLAQLPCSDSLNTPEIGAVADRN